MSNFWGAYQVGGLWFLNTVLLVEKDSRLCFCQFTDQILEVNRLNPGETAIRIIQIFVSDIVIKLCPFFIIGNCFNNFVANIIFA